MSSPLNFINVVPVYPDQIDFTVSEILRQHRDIGLTKFALSLSFHPEGTPARDKVSMLVNALSAITGDLRKVPSVELGVLLQSTMGHGWSGPVPLTNEPWQRIVNMDGAVSSRMCPSDRAFRDYILYAVDETMKTGPKFLLLDDDYGLRPGECFCPNHIAMFNQTMKRNYTFEELVNLIRTKPWNDPEVMIFSRQRGEIAVEFGREIRQVIDRHDATVPCSYCCCCVGQGFAADLAKALSSPQAAPSVRVNNAYYGSNYPQNLYSIACRTPMVMYQLHGVNDIIDEADTFPQNYYSENAALFHLHIVSGILNGLNGAKLWMSEFNQPQHTASQSRYEELFKQNMGLYEELFATLKGIRWQGVAKVLYHPPFMLHPEKCLTAVYGTEWNQLLLGPYGIPIRATDEKQEGIFNLTETEAVNLSAEQLKILFTKALLIDSKAAKVLTKRGFAQYMGVKTVEDAQFFFKGEYKDGWDCALWLMWEEKAAKLECLSDKTRIVTHCVDGQTHSRNGRKVAPCMTFFNNSCGGRIVVTAWTPEMPFYQMLRPQRRELMLEALDFLSGGLLEMTVEVPHHVMVQHGKLHDDSELLAVISLGIDPVPAIPVRCQRRVAHLEQLSPEGKWLPVKYQQTKQILNIDTPLKHCETNLFRLHF
ncbi:MAG: hypothetical protein WCT05_02925 [Lentisphaeria bacterium]